MSQLDAYLSTWTPNVTHLEAQEYIQQGKALFKQIMLGEIVNLAQSGVKAAEALTSLMWFFMHRALEKKQGHSHGSFAIEDEQNRLYHFLKLVPKCADRASSHYIGRSEKWTGKSHTLMTSSCHQGVDVLNGKMPAEKRHILFGQVNTLTKDKLLFIKLEDYSPFKTTAYGLDAVMHGVGLIQSQYDKQLLPGNDDLPEMCKARIPHQALTEFTKLVNPNLDQMDKRTGKEVYIAKEDFATL